MPTGYLNSEVQQAKKCLEKHKKLLKQNDPYNFFLQSYYTIDEDCGKLGALGYLTELFLENNVNIFEYTDIIPIGYGYGCYFDQLIIPANIKVIGEFAFCSAEISSIVWQGKPSTIGTAAFNFASIPKLELPEGLTVIKSNAFYHLQDVDFIKFPSSLEYIGSQAFGKIKSHPVIDWPDDVDLYEVCEDIDTLNYLEREIVRGR